VMYATSRRSIRPAEKCRNSRCGRCCDGQGAAEAPLTNLGLPSRLERARVLSPTGRSSRLRQSGI